MVSHRLVISMCLACCLQLERCRSLHAYGYIQPHTWLIYIVLQHPLNTWLFQPASCSKKRNTRYTLLFTFVHEKEAPTHMHGAALRMQGLGRVQASLPSRSFANWHWCYAELASLSPCDWSPSVDDNISCKPECTWRLQCSKQMFANIM